MKAKTTTWRPALLLIPGTMLLSMPTRAEVVFEANFETGIAEALVGELHVRHEPVVQVMGTSTADATLGRRVLLVDRELEQLNGLSLTWCMTRAVSLSGSGATVEFGFAARRTWGASKTTYVTGWDRKGLPVFQLVLGDAYAFGNAADDRQRPGYATRAGNSLLPGPSVPGKYWWGSDTDGDTRFDVSKDASFRVTVKSDSWDLWTRKKGGLVYSTTGLPTYDGETHGELAMVTVTNGGEGNFGGFWDNLRVEGQPAGVPVGAGMMNVDLATQGPVISRWGYDIKQDGKAEGLTPELAHDLFVEDGLDLMRIPIWGDIDKPAHPSAGVVDGSYYEAVLTAVANAKAANPEVMVFASKKTRGQDSFPDWAKDGNGIIPHQYAMMLADFLLHMEQNGLVVDYLGIDNAGRNHEGKITAQKHAAVIDELRVLAILANFAVPQLIAAEDAIPVPDWVNDLNAGGWGDCADLFGTHYFSSRPLPALTDMVTAAGGKEVWNTEVHWENMDPRNVLDEAERALLAFFDSTDLGLTGFSWWNYRRDGFKGEMMRALVRSTHHGRPLPVTDADGADMVVAALNSRAFLTEGAVNLWVMNASAATDYPLQSIEVTGAVDHEAYYTRWTEAGTYDGAAELDGSGNALMSFPRRSLTLVTIPVDSSLLQILAIRLLPGVVELEVVFPGTGSEYHVGAGETLDDFVSVSGSTVVPAPGISVLTVPRSGEPRMFYRVVEGAE